MSIRRQYPGQLPSDAVILTYDDALHHQLDIIRNWPKTSEAWPLRAGVSVLSVAASASGIYINNHFRRKLRLRNIGLFTTYLPIVVMPGLATSVIHKLLITHHLIMDSSPCPLCLGLRAAGIQATVGFIYPLLLAPLGNCMYATRHGTYRLPDITSDFRGAVKQLIKFGRPIGIQLSLICVGQFLLGSYFTYLESKSYYIIQKHLFKIEEEYDNNRKTLENELN